jgi:hypothetical protein
LVSLRPLRQDSLERAHPSVVLRIEGRQVFQPSHHGGIVRGENEETKMQTPAKNLPTATNYNNLEWLQWLIYRLDKGDACEYCEPSLQMKTIIDAVKDAPEADEASIDSLLARILLTRLQANNGWQQ